MMDTFRGHDTDRRSPRATCTPRLREAADSNRLSAPKGQRTPSFAGLPTSAGRRVNAVLVAAALAHAAQKGSFMYTGTHQQEWRCSRCSTLLGVERSGKLHIKYKAAQFTVEGSIVAVCRRCAEQNHAESHHQQPTPVETRA